MSRRSSRTSARSSRTSARTPLICMLKAIAIAMTVPRIHWASRLGMIDRLPHTCTTSRCPTTPRDPSPYARRYQPRPRFRRTATFARSVDKRCPLPDRRRARRDGAAGMVTAPSRSASERRVERGISLYMGTAAGWTITLATPSEPGPAGQ